MKWREGEFCVDNRKSGGELFECATVTCCHCGVIVILNPDRERPRNYCRKCDNYVCDNPNCSKECAPKHKTFDHAQEQFFRADEGYSPLPDLPWNAPGNLIKHKDI